MSNGHIFQPPNPEGSPLEKLALPKRAHSLWKLERNILHSGLDEEVARNLVEAFKEYDNDRYYEELQNFYRLEHWANIHTHAGGFAEPGELEPIFATLDPIYWYRLEIEEEDLEEDIDNLLGDGPLAFIDYPANSSEAEGITPNRGAVKFVSPSTASSWGGFKTYAFSFSSARTFIATLKYNGGSSSSGAIFAYSSGGNTTSYRLLRLNPEDSSEDSRIKIESDPASSNRVNYDVTADYDVGLIANNWFQVILTADEDGVRLYVNGNFIDEDTEYEDLNILSDNMRVWHGGASTSSGGYAGHRIRYWTGQDFICLRESVDANIAAQIWNSTLAGY